jgi:hypothetical protein
MPNKSTRATPRENTEKIDKRKDSNFNDGKENREACTPLAFMLHEISKRIEEERVTHLSHGGRWDGFRSGGAAVVERGLAREGWAGVWGKGGKASAMRLWCGGPEAMPRSSGGVLPVTATCHAVVTAFALTVWRELEATACSSSAPRPDRLANSKSGRRRPTEIPLVQNESIRTYVFMLLPYCRAPGL